jgi:peptidylprolyl isomerase
VLALALAFGALGASACKRSDASAADGGASESGAAAAAASASAPAGLPAPPDVAAPPADAQRTASGLASKVLAPGSGTEHPGQNDTVKVNYSGWTTDGKMFDSSVAPLHGRRPEPTTFPLGHVIAGWTEGVQLMVVGEKRRFWIPEELAYKGKPGAPAGMLVFDIELLDFTPGPKPPEDVAAAPADAEKTKDGLASKVTQKGTGKDHPKASDGVRVNYSMWQTDGKLLDASKDKPVVRPVTGITDGWAEGVQLMVTGEKRTFWVPAALASAARPGAPPPGNVTMVIELLDIFPAPKTPADVKAPPKDAVVEKDGLATKILTKGTGTTHPAKNSSVTVQYAGWTTDGKMFDSSYTRGEPSTFGVGNVIDGWTEALQLMVEGEKRRIWIPEELAYKGQPSRPQGMLVFDVELQKINDAPPRMMMPGMSGGPGGGLGRPPGRPHP